MQKETNKLGDKVIMRARNGDRNIINTSQT